jgi:hypothetical protein
MRVVWAFKEAMLSDVCVKAINVRLATFWKLAVEASADWSDNLNWIHPH